MVLSFVILSGQLTARDNAERGSGLEQHIARAVTARPLDAQALRSLLEPLGWGVTPESDGSITLIPDACRQTVAPAIQARKTQQVMKLIKDKGYSCLNCHQIDTKLRGPSFKDVATKRRCYRWAVELLTYKLSVESSGPYETAHHMQLVSAEDAPIIVNWVLSF